MVLAQEFAMPVYVDVFFSKSFKLQLAAKIQSHEIKDSEKPKRFTSGTISIICLGSLRAREKFKKQMLTLYHEGLYYSSASNITFDTLYW